MHELAGQVLAGRDIPFQNAPKCGLDNFKSCAKQAATDVAAVERWHARGKYKPAGQKDIDEGRAAGVTATPAFFINGRLLFGAQPLEAFVRVIEDEWAQKN